MSTYDVYGAELFFEIAEQATAEKLTLLTEHRAYSSCSAVVGRGRTREFEFLILRSGMDSFIHYESDDDGVVLVADDLDSRKRSRSGRLPSDVWNEIVPYNPAPNGDHNSCQCKQCLVVFNHPIKKRASRMTGHLLKCNAYKRSTNGVSPIH